MTTDAAWMFSPTPPAWIWLTRPPVYVLKNGKLVATYPLTQTFDAI